MGKKDKKMAARIRHKIEKGAWLYSVLATKKSTQNMIAMGSESGEERRPKITSTDQSQKLT